MPPPSLTTWVQRLPPILHTAILASTPTWSKAPRGLFVLVWVPSIFTQIAISPSPSLRQRPDRYTIRAGRNLPDKEFRYLRTVIVTAAVHWGFGSSLRAALPLTFQHWAGVSPYTAPCGLAETGGFVNQSPGPLHCGSSCDEHLFSRSYEVNLPSSLTRAHSFTLAKSACPPESVCGTDVLRLPTTLFLTTQAHPGWIRPEPPPPDLARRAPHQATVASPSPLLDCHAADVGFIASGRGRNINRHSIGSPASRWYALGPPNPPRMDRAAEPLGFRCAGFAPAIRYSYRHSHFAAVHTSFRSCFLHLRTLPYHVTCMYR